MKIVFFGTPVFAASILDQLSRLEHEIVAVVSKPDKPKGRQRKLLPTPVKQKAQELGLPVFQPLKASSDDFENDLINLNADLFFVVGYGEILRQSLLDIPSHGCVNVHTSLLPRWRGAAPVRRAMMAGDEVIGVSLMYMSLGLDEGDVIEQKGFKVDPSWNYAKVMQEIEGCVASILPSVLLKVESSSNVAEAQEHALANYAHKIEDSDCWIDFNESGYYLQRRIQALSPDIGMRCYIDVEGEKKLLKLWESSFVAGKEDPNAEIGELGAFEMTKKGLKVFVKEGFLLVHELQIEGKKRMDHKSLMNGFQGKTLGQKLLSK